MGAFKITVDDNKRILIAGSISFETVPDLAKALDALIDSQTDIIINLVDVSHSDSSALALMLHCYRFAQNRNKALHFQAIPSALLAVAELCGMSNFLPQTKSL